MIRNLFYKHSPKNDILNLALLLSGTVIFLYFAPQILGALWLVFMLVLYFRSKNEALWLVYFLVLTDGFMSLFGLYSAVVPLLPGLPEIEVSQFYIIISFYKALRKQDEFSVFYKKILVVILIYLAFLILWGILSGLSGGMNVYFRVIKLTLPLVLFYSIPKLFTQRNQYNNLFRLLFPIAILATITQLTEIITGLTPSIVLGLVSDEALEIADEEIYRGFYNPNIVLLSFFGALHYMSLKIRTFKTWYLSIVITATLAMVFLSATRGWILGFGTVMFLYVVFLQRLNLIRIFGIGLVIGLAIILGITNSNIKQQIDNSRNRLLTLSDLREGDITAGGTVKRLNVRSPRVINKWLESPVIGWGYSDNTFRYQDAHVGNQTILLQSGILGALIMLFFFFIFNSKLLRLSLYLPVKNPYKKSLAVFPIFFLGWFIIHSTSSQQFSYGLLPGDASTQAIFFSMGALYYKIILRKDFVGRRSIK